MQEAVVMIQMMRSVGMRGVFRVNAGGGYEVVEDSAPAAAAGPAPPALPATDTVMLPPLPPPPTGSNAPPMASLRSDAGLIVEPETIPPGGFPRGEPPQGE